ncbi:YkvA family protein [Abyssisolibacter fermentans]|uniref:YkvA family protein n=1 Tax=Abyssisolibacter fermentans TaxID=1766203 RepID=UPI000833428D|nr:YkvA family protein [Abyssisolibacter fermentans]
MKILNFFKKIKIIFKYLFDTNVKFRKKILLIIGLVYLISPLDLLPDPVFGIGLIDDIFILSSIIISMREKIKDYEKTLKYGRMRDAETGKIIDFNEFNNED